MCVLCLSLPSVMSVYCSLVVTCWERADFLGSLVCDSFLYFCHFLILCPGSGVVVDYIDPDICLLSNLQTDP